MNQSGRGIPYREFLEKGLGLGSIDKVITESKKTQARKKLVGRSEDFRSRNRKVEKKHSEFFLPPKEKKKPPHNS
jgi:hypothetical protein